MIRISPSIRIALVLLTILLIGCSGKDNPITINSLNETRQFDTPAITSDINFREGHAILGLFNGKINAKTLTGELTPIRLAQSQDVLEVIDLTNFLTLVPCSDCVKLHSVYLDTDGHVTADIGIKHPFPAGDPLQAPSASNRLDLHVFNVEGIVSIKGQDYQMFPITGVTLDKNGMLNASGYTSYLNSSLDEFFFTPANAHPYVLHFRDYSNGNYNPEHPNGFEDLRNPSGYLVMPMGSKEDIRPYTFNMEGNESIEFVFAIGATYGISAESKADRLDPKYCLPQFNKKAASEVFVDIVANNLYANIPSSWATIDIQVLDMNHGVPVGVGQGQVRALSNVLGVIVEIPGLTSSISLSNPNPISGDPRDPSDPMTYRLTFQNTLWAPEGTYRGVIKVFDSYPPGLNRTPILNDKDGIERVEIYENPLSGLFDIPQFATYQTFKIDVIPSPGNVPPIADLDASMYTVGSGQTIELYPGPNCLDPDGTIVFYEYDFNYDGLNFTTDASNTSGNPVTTPPLINTNPDPIKIDMAMRVTDDGNPIGRSMDTVEITVEFSGNLAPIAVLDATETWIEPGENTNLFPGDGTMDPDGSIILYEYDFNYDGSVFTMDASNLTGLPVATPIFNNIGRYTVAMRVTDNGTPGLTDIDDLEITVGDIIGWARTWGWEQQDLSNGVCADLNGNVYVVGNFEGLVDFDPDPSYSDPHTSNGIADAFLTKFDPVGDFKWARTFGGPDVDDRDTGYSVDTDSSGNVYVAGIFFGTADFDPSTSGVDEHTSNGYGDIFVSKYNSNGDYQWTNTFGGTQWDNVKCINIDKFDNIYITGEFYGNVDFNPDETEQDIHNATGSTDVFLIKYNPTSDYLWGISWGNTSYYYDTGYGLGSDTSGNIYVTGYFYGTVDFDPGSGTDNHTTHGATSKQDAYLSKFDSSGAFQWVNTWGGDDDDQAIDLAVDSFGNIYVTGIYQFTVDFDPDPGQTEDHTSIWGYDIFASKFDSTGDFLWVLTWGTAQSEYEPRISVDSSTNFWITGRADGTIDFDFGAGNTDTSVNGSFLAKYDLDGDYQWVRTWTYYPYSMDLDADAWGNSYLAGYYYGYWYDFDPGSGIWNPPWVDYYDACVIKVLSNGYWN